MKESRVAASFQLATDATKCISIIGATFQLMPVGVQVTVLVGESRRGAEQYPLLLGFTVRLYREVVKSMDDLFVPPGTIGDLHSENLRRVLPKTMELMEKAEHELMRSEIMQVLTGYELKKVEEKADALERKVLLISTNADVQILKTDVMGLKAGENAEVPVLCGRPKLTKYFSGRAAQLEVLHQKWLHMERL